MYLPNKDKMKLFKNIRSRHFKKLFFKNWITVFLCISVPLIISVWFIHYNNQQALLLEIDESAQRSTRNATSTFETLLKEAHNTLEREILDSDITTFFHLKSETPPSYGFISTVRNAQSRISSDHHDNLYYSVDCYAAETGFLTSSKYLGQTYRILTERTGESLVTCYEEYRANHPGANSFAVLREMSYRYQAETETEPPQVITIYQAHPMPNYNGSFVSISIDPEKLTDFVVDTANTENGCFLLVDEENRMMFDSSDKLTDTVFEIETETHLFTSTIDNQLVRVFWTPMELFNWKCLQIIPLTEYQYSTQRLQTLAFSIIALAVIAGMMISYAVTARLYRPMEAILSVVENPQSYQASPSTDDELQYILVQILSLFQKNITLENEMLDRVLALRRLRANALQKQMTPHFLNNILNVINWTAIEETGNENSVTSRQIVLLSDIIRTMKEQTGSLTTVAAEIEYTKKFVELECLRYGPQIHCSYEIDEAVLSSPIPAISLQTLVENAVAHGLQPNGAIGNICIKILPNEIGGLHICVEDDGVGMEQSEIDRIFETLEQEFTYSGEHLGLINLFQRFRLIYTEECQFHICQRETGGLRVEIDTPTTDPAFLT